eukprot:3668399-Pleurochrysis_carterae.AAC.2
MAHANYFNVRVCTVLRKDDSTRKASAFTVFYITTRLVFYQYHACREELNLLFVKNILGVAGLTLEAFLHPLIRARVYELVLHIFTIKAFHFMVLAVN